MEELRLKTKQNDINKIKSFDSYSSVLKKYIDKYQNGIKIKDKESAFIGSFESKTSFNNDISFNLIPIECSVFIAYNGEYKISVAE